MSADIPNLIIPRDNGSTHTDHLHAITTYLDQAIKDNTETIDDFQTRLERVRSHFETTLPQTRLQTDRLSVIAQDLDAVSQVVARLSGGRIKEGEKKKEKANITTTTTLTGTQLTASPAANPASPEQPIITTNSPVTQPPSTSPKLPKPQVPCAPGPRPSPLLPSEIPPAIDEFTGADLRRGLLEMPQNWQNMPTAEPAHNEFPPASAPQEEATGAASLWWPGLGWPSAGWQSGQVEPEAKDKVEVEKEPENESQATTTTTTNSTTATQNGTQILPLPTPNRKSPGCPTTATNPAPPSTTLDKTATVDQVKKPKRVRTPKKAPQGPQRRSMRIIESAQKGGRTGKSTTKSKSPILKPKAGAGVTKKTAIESIPNPTPDKVKQNPQIEASKELESQNQDSVSTINKPTKPRRAKTPGKVPQVPQRRSMRIMESTKKKAEDKLTTVKPESPIIKQKAGAGVSKRGGRGGARGGTMRGG